MVIRYSVPQAWYNDVYQDKNTPVDAGRSFSIIHKRDEKPEKCVLLIHGYTGYPGELVRPARDLFEAGFDVFVPRLPGHGTTGKDFLKTDKKDWCSVALNAANDLKDKYKDLYVLGHSMGGAIASIVASSVEGVKKVALCCPALALEKKKLPARPWVLRLLSIFKKELPTKWQSDPEYVFYYEGAPKDDQKLGSEYWSHLFPKELYSLFTLMLEAGKSIKNIKCPILLIVSKGDKILGTFPKDVVDKEKRVEVETLTLEKASHYIFYDKDKDEEERAVRKVVSFFES